MLDNAAFIRYLWKEHPYGKKEKIIVEVLVKVRVYKTEV